LAHCRECVGLRLVDQVDGLPCARSLASDRKLWHELDQHGNRVTEVAVVVRNDNADTF
jgi:hypothetical protein